MAGLACASTQGGTAGCDRLLKTDGARYQRVRAGGATEDAPELPGHRRRGACRFRVRSRTFGFPLAGVVEQSWVFATLAAACVIMLSSGIFASWLLVLQIGLPTGEKP
jgi:hypothetical protein